MSDTSSNSEIENISTKHLLKRLGRLERKYKKIKRKGRERTRSTSNKRSRSYKDYRSPSGSESQRDCESRSRSRDSRENRSNERQERDYRSLYGSGSRNKNTDRALYDSASVLSQDDHDPRDMASRVDNSEVRAEQEIIADAPVACEQSPILQIHNNDDITDEFLEILGEDPENKNSITFDIHPALSSRWGHIIRNGIPSSDKDKLLER